MRTLHVLVVALLGLLLAASPALATGNMQPPKEIDRPTRFIEDKLFCQCGENMVLSSCDCEVANEFRQIIASKMTAGESEAQILAYFVGKYGETVLTAPTKEGFNLVAWITPYVVPLIGLVVLLLLLRSWVKRFYAGRASLASPTGADAADLTETELADLDRVTDMLRRNF